LSFLKTASDEDKLNIFRVVTPNIFKPVLYAADITIERKGLIVRAISEDMQSVLNFAETDGHIVFIGNENLEPKAKKVEAVKTKVIDKSDLENIHAVFDEYPDPKNRYIKMKYKRPLKKKGKKLFLSKDSEE